MPDRPRDIAIRAAGAGEVDTLFRIRLAVTENAQSLEELESLGVTPASVAEMIESGSHVALLAEEHGKALGFAMGELKAAYVFALFVLPEHEGRGIGGALMSALEAVFVHAGQQDIWLTTDPDPRLRARGFYRYCGWSEDGILDDGQIRLRKRITPRA